MIFSHMVWLGIAIVTFGIGKSKEDASEDESTFPLSMYIRTPRRVEASTQNGGHLLSSKQSLQASNKAIPLLGFRHMNLKPLPDGMTPQFNSPIPSNYKKQGKGLPFNFQYIVDDEGTSNFQTRQEETDASGVVRGCYQVLEPTGYVRTVIYIADEGGYRVLSMTKSLDKVPCSAPNRQGRLTPFQEEFNKNLKDSRLRFKNNGGRRDGRTFPGFQDLYQKTKKTFSPFNSPGSIHKGERVLSVKTFNEGDSSADIEVGRSESRDRVATKPFVELRHVAKAATTEGKSLMNSDARLHDAEPVMENFATPVNTLKDEPQIPNSVFPFDIGHNPFSLIGLNPLKSFHRNPSIKKKNADNSNDVEGSEESNAKLQYIQNLRDKLFDSYRNIISPNLKGDLNLVKFPFVLLPISSFMELRKKGIIDENVQGYGAVIKSSESEGASPQTSYINEKPSSSQSHEIQNYNYGRFQRGVRSTPSIVRHRRDIRRSKDNKILVYNELNSNYSPYYSNNKISKPVRSPNSGKLRSPKKYVSNTGYNLINHFIHGRLQNTSKNINNSVLNALTPQGVRNVSRDAISQNKNPYYKIQNQNGRHQARPYFQNGTEISNYNLGAKLIDNLANNQFNNISNSDSIDDSNLRNEYKNRSLSNYNNNYQYYLYNMSNVKVINSYAVNHVGKYYLNNNNNNNNNINNNNHNNNRSKSFNFYYRDISDTLDYGKR